MLKRISVDQLTVGMYIHEFDGSYLDSPFWRKSFAVNDASDLARVQRAGIAGAWIDTARGSDVRPAPATREREEEEEHFVAEATRPMELLDLPDSREPKRDAGRRLVALRNQARDTIHALHTEARMGRAVDAAQCLPLVDEISKSLQEDPGQFISLVRLKRQDEYTYMHSVAVCALMVGLARQIGLKPDQVRLAGLAGMMHDVGKAVMPLEVLNKAGKLTDGEYRIMREHPVRGFELLRDGTDEVVGDVCLHHHEKFDGSGYPEGLSGDKLSLYARMGAVCDVYDAITSNRPYKQAWDPGESLRLMATWKGHFDPAIFQAFVKTVGIYPVGTLVRLQSARLAVVCTQNPQSLLAPKVKAIFSVRSNMRILPEEIDLASPWTKDKIVSVERPEDWKLGNLDNFWAPPDRL